MTSLLSGSNPGSAASAGLSKVDLPISTEFKLVLNNNAAAKVAFSTVKYDLFLGAEKFLAGNSTQIENKGRSRL